MIIISCYTPNYKEAAERFEETLKRFNLRYKFYPYDHLGNWTKNTQYKSKVVLKALQEFIGEPVIFIDADAEIKSYPKLFDELGITCDVAFHQTKIGELLSGTVYFANTPKCVELVRKWNEINDSREDWDQRTLQEAVKNTPNLKIVILPEAYTKIFDRGRVDPVVQHNQLSRKQKAVSDNNGVTPPVRRVNNTLGLPPAVRQKADGVIFLIRHNKALEDQFDREYIRIPRSLEWVPVNRGRGLFKDNELLKNRVAQIVGKGPSLDRLLFTYFLPNEPIIALNEAATVLHDMRDSIPNKNDFKIIGLQQDFRVGPVKADYHFVGRDAHRLYEDADNIFKYHGEEYGGTAHSLSVIMAIRICKEAGVKAFRLICFDACVNSTIGYAKVINKNPAAGGYPERFLGHRGQIDQELEGCSVEWVIP